MDLGNNHSVMCFGRHLGTYMVIDITYVPSRKKINVEVTPPEWKRYLNQNA